MSDADREQQDLFEFLYACPVGLVEFDSTGTIGMINPHAMKHLLPLAGMRDSGNLFAILEGSAPEIRNLFERFDGPRGTVCDGHRIAVDMGRGLGRNGGHGGSGRAARDPKTLACTIVKLANDRAIATFADITVQVTQERRLKEAETWFASLLNGVNDYAVLSITPDGIIDTVNASFTRQTGHACADVAGRSLDLILDADAASGSLSLDDQLHIAEHDGWYLDESWMTRRDGERYWCQRLVSARTAEDGTTLTGFSVVLRDVVPQRSDTASLRRMLTRDHLTGAANRAHFLAMVERELRRWHKDRRIVSLVLIDIDHFKAVNDVHGHPIGDIVLQRISEACSAVLRPTDLFARLGGEEFAALLPDTSLDQAATIAETLRHAVIGVSIDTDRGTLSVTASFGCATATDDDATIEALVKSADDQLYAAKRGGRNRVCADRADAAATPEDDHAAVNGLDTRAADGRVESRADGRARSRAA